MGNALQNMIGVSVILGVNGALNTLVSHAAGAGNIDLCLRYLRRCQIAMSLCFIPISAIVLNSTQILIAVGQDPVVAHYAH